MASGRSPKSSKSLHEEKNIPDPAAPRRPQSANSHLHKIPADIQLLSSSFLDTKSLGSLASSCALFSTVLKDDLDKRALDKLLQAVIDDDRATVKRILDKNPALLLVNPADHGVQQIESQKTWQIFKTKKVLTMARKRNQLEMIKVLMPYFAKLPDSAAELAKQWEAGEVKPANYDEILLPILNQIVNDPPEDKNPSEATEAALTAFRTLLLPDTAIDLDNYFDMEQFLLAAYTIYDTRFDTFQNWEQRALFCIRVIGFLQSLQSVEVAKVFCEGLYYVVNENRKISARAESLKFYDGCTSFYRAARDSIMGLGY